MKSRPGIGLVIASVLLLSQLFALPAIPPLRDAQASVVGPTIAAGSYHTCALTQNGDTYCWGSIHYGEASYIEILPFGSSKRPQRVTGIPPFQAISAGSDHTCALTSGGRAYCWGLNYLGQLGNGTEEDSLSPTPVSGNHTFVAIAAGDIGSCALTASGSAYCWGKYGGYEALTPVLVSDDLSFAVIAAGASHACGLTSSGQAYCWGWNDYGQLGNGRISDVYSTPVRVSGGHTFVAISGGFDRTCALTASGRAYCWGAEYGPAPVRVNSSQHFTTISTGHGHTCALTDEGEAYCWGWNSSGKLGDGTTVGYRSTPVRVDGGHRFVAISAGGDHTVALGRDGCWYGWGSDYNYQIGVSPIDNIRGDIYISPVQIACLSGAVPLNRFEKLAPANNSTGTLLENVRLSWSAFAADHYRYCVSTTPNCEPNISAGSATSALVPGRLTPSSTYYWQVRACQDADCTTFTDAEGGHWSFTTYSGVGSQTSIIASPALVPSLRKHSVVTLTLYTADNQPWAGERVRLSTDRPAVDSVVPSEGVTNEDGQFTAVVHSSGLGLSRISAQRVAEPHITIAQTIIKFEEKEPYLNVDEAFVKADGIAEATLTLKAVDANGVPVTNRLFEFYSPYSGVVITPREGRTGRNGILTARVKSTQAGKAPIEARSLENGLDLRASTEIYFVGPESIAARLHVSPETLTAGGSARISIQSFFVERFAEKVTETQVPLKVIRFQDQPPTYTVSYVGVGQAELRASHIGTATITVLNAYYDTPIARVEVPVVSSCAMRPEILAVVPSFKLGRDFVYPRLPQPSRYAMYLDSNVTVDWKGCTPGAIIFELSDGKQKKEILYAQSNENIKTHYAIRSFNLLSDLPFGPGQLRIIAVTSDGLQSAPWTTEVASNDWPDWLLHVMGYADLAAGLFSNRVSSLSIQSVNGAPPTFSISKVWPNNEGWVFAPKLDTGQSTGEGDEAEAKEIAKRKSIKLKLIGALDLPLSCDTPPSLKFQFKGNRKEIAKIKDLSLGGALDLSLSYEFDRNYLCVFFAGYLNEDYLREYKGAGSLGAEVYAEWKEALMKLLAKFFPPVAPGVEAACKALEEADKVFATGLKCEQMLGEVTAKAGAGFKLNSKLAFAPDNRNSIQAHLLETTTSVGPKVSAEYAYTVKDLLEIKLEGSGSAVLKFGSARPVRLAEAAPVSQVELDASAKVGANLFNLWSRDAEWKYNYKWNLLPPSGQSAQTSSLDQITVPFAAQAAPLTDSAIFKLIPPASHTPDYAGFASERMVSPSSMGAPMAVGSSAVITGILASGNLTHTEVSIAHRPATGRTLLVWTQDVPARPVGGSREIYYSVWNGAAWSAPAAVTSDSVSDLAPQVTWLNDQYALAVWNRAHDILSESLRDIRKIEVAYAVYDSLADRWSSVQYLTNDNHLDYSLTLSSNGQGQALAAWVSLEDNAAALEVAFFNAQGNPQRQEIILSHDHNLFGLSSAFSNQKAVIAYSEHFVAPGMTPTLRTAAVVWDEAATSWSDPIPIPFLGWSEERQSHPAVVIDRAGTPWLAHIRSGLTQMGNSGRQSVFEIQSLQTAAPMSASVNLGDLIVDRMQLHEGNQGLVAVLRGSRFDRDLYALVASDRWSQWSKPIKLTDDSAFEASFDAYMKDDALTLGYVRTLYEMVTRTREVDGELITSTMRQASGTEMVALSKQLQYRPDLTVVSDSITIVLPEDAPALGATALVSATLLNQGEVEANAVQIGLYQGDPTLGGTLLMSRSLPTALGAGFTETVGFAWVVPTANAFDLYVVADPTNHIDELNEANNAAFVRAFGHDLRLRPPLVDWQEGAQIALHVPIFSAGTTQTLPSELTVTLKTLEGAEIATASSTVPPVAPGDTYTAVLNVNVSNAAAGTYSVTTLVRSPLSGQVQELENTLKLRPNLAVSPELTATDVTVPFIYVAGNIRNTSWLTVSNVAVGIFDVSQQSHTGLLASKTIPVIGPMATVPISFVIGQAAPCGLQMQVNPALSPDTFIMEQRYSDNSAFIHGPASFCARAGFLKSAHSGIAPLTVVFTNTSTPNTTAWEWDFGDGVTSSLQTPGAHVYTQPGIYTVTLRATGPLASTVWQERMAVKVYAAASANFESPKREVLVGEPVQFTNLSTGDVLDYTWDFGDGTTSSLESPTHFYEKPGRYSVVLTVKGPGGTDVMSRTDYITVMHNRAFVPIVQSAP